MHPSFANRPLLAIVLTAALLSPAVNAAPSINATPAKPVNRKAFAPKVQPAPAVRPPGTTSIAAPRQNQGDALRSGKSQAGQSLRPPIPTREELLARIPASGPLNGEDLILLAIANSPDLERRRAEITGARAAKQSAADWENPELRFSYASQDEDSLQLPYTETIKRSLSPFPVNSYREIERIVTPGRDFDSYTINEYDVFEDPLSPSRNLISSSFEQRSSTEINDGGEETGVMIRFRLPNPWERKARIARAAAEILLAEAQYLAEEDQLVRDVRDLYELLGTYGSEISVHEKRISNYRAMRTEMESFNDPGLMFEVVRARSEMTGIMNDLSEVQRDFEKTRIEIARLCGLREYQRITGGGVVTRRHVDPSSLNEAYLLDLAMLYRADAVEASARHQIAVARLAEAKAQGKVFATFLDAGYSEDREDGRSGHDSEWYVRLGVQIPLWDLVRINKGKREWAQYVIDMQRALELQRRKISVDIGLALAELRVAARQARQADGDLNEARREAMAVENSLKTVEARDIGDAGRKKRTKYDFEDMIQQSSINRLSAWSDYNKALRRLEDAIGTRIEKALSGGK